MLHIRQCIHCSNESTRATWQLVPQNYSPQRQRHPPLNGALVPSVSNDSARSLLHWFTQHNTCLLLHWSEPCLLVILRLPIIQPLTGAGHRCPVYRYRCCWNTQPLKAKLRCRRNSKIIASGKKPHRYPLQTLHWHSRFDDAEHNSPVPVWFAAATW